MIITANILFLLFVIWWLSNLSPPYGKLLFSLALIYKILAAIVLGVIYIHYLQTGDTIVYFNEAQKISDISEKSFQEYIGRLLMNEYPEYKGEYRTEFFSKILSVFLIITGKNYWLTSIYLSLISFMGNWYLIKIIYGYDNELKWPAFIGFMIVPSVVFWSSGILKDSLANAGFFYLCTFLISSYQKKPISLIEHIAYALSLIIVIKLRFYLGAIMIITIGFLFAWRFLHDLVISRPIRYSLLTVFTLGLIVAASLIDYNLQFKHLPESIYTNYQSIIRSSGSNHLSFDLSPDWTGILINFPKSLLHGLFGPFPGQGSLASAEYWIENGLLIVVGCWSIILMIRNRNIFKNITPLHIFLVGYILLLATVLPLVAPNFGTMMRYKSAFLPFLWLILLYLPIKNMKYTKSV